MLGFVIRHKIILGFTVLFVFLRLPSLFEPYWYGDEGIYLVLGQAIRRGLVLYQQIHDNKPPSLYYLAAIGKTVFGFRLLLLLWMIPTIYFFSKLSQKLLNKKIATIATLAFLVITSVPAIEGTIANAEIFMLLPTIVAFLLFIRNIESKIGKNQNTLFLTIGLLLGFAFSIKVPVAVEFGLLFLWLFFSHPKSLKPYLLTIGFLIPTIIISVYSYFQGALLPYLNAALLQNIGYLSSWTTGNHTSSLGNSGLGLRAVVLFFVWFSFFVLYLKNKLNRNTLFLLTWFAATIFGALLSGRPYPHYLIQTLPPLLLLLGHLLSKSSYRAIIIFGLIIFVVIVIRYKFYFYPVLPYYQNFYSYIIGIKPSGEYRAFFGLRTNNNILLSDYLKNKTSINDKIFVWGDQPSIYALSNRLPVGRFTVAYHIIDFNAYSETVDNIRASLPPYIIFYPMDNRAFPELDKMIAKYYYQDRVFGDILLYKKR